MAARSGLSSACFKGNRFLRRCRDQDCRVFLLIGEPLTDSPGGG
jgi:hypothetical protein